MKQRPKAVVALLAALIFVAIVISFLRPATYVVNREQFDRINVDSMSQEDVEKLLGGPPRNCLNCPAMVWTPQADGGLISARISPGTPMSRFFRNTPGTGRQVVWITEEGLIAAHFGDEGRLKEKYFSTVHTMGGPPGIGGLFSRPSKARPAGPQTAAPAP